LLLILLEYVNINKFVCFMHVIMLGSNENEYVVNYITQEILE
jgi:hypothetical protein